MKRLPALLTVACFFVAGCAGEKTMDAPRAGRTQDAAPMGAAAPGQDSGVEAATTPLVATVENTAGTPVPIEGDSVALAPSNTRIEFVGTHAGDKPDPRTGGFEKFSGKVQIDPATKGLKSVTLEIDAASLWTEIGKLTEHLKSADFFEVREYPTATFESTSIEKGGSEGQHMVTGKLTLHGVTKEISAPATVQVGEQGLTLRSQFNIDRSEFGMTFSPDRVENKVALTVVVGEKTQPRRP